MRAIACLLLALASACAEDVATAINVAPSAEAHWPALLEAVDRVHAETGREVFTLAAIGDAERRDGEIVVRGTDSLGKSARGYPIRANTTSTRDGVIVRLTPAATAHVVAHELLHAAGLEHVDEPGNIMFDDAAGVGWKLEEWQAEALP